MDTERASPRYADIDLWEPSDILDAMIEGQMAAVAAVRGCPAQIYNRFYDGGFLIWFVPERPVFIDNRQDPYPSPFILETTEVELEEFAGKVDILEGMTPRK